MSFVQKLLCRRYAPLLTPYREGALNDALRSRVAAHLNACPNCRAELTELSAIAALLRAHPPIAAKPRPDLWSQLEAQIRAEAPRLAPVTPQRTTPADSPFAWGVFGRAFASGGAVVAAGVVCALVVLQKGVEWNPPVHESPAATIAPRVPESSEPVIIALQPLRKTASAAPRFKSFAMNAPAAKAQSAPRVVEATMKKPVLPIRLIRFSLAEPAPEQTRRSIQSIQIAIRPSASRVAAQEVRPSSYAVSDAIPDGPVALGLETLAEPRDTDAFAFQGDDNAAKSLGYSYGAWAVTLLDRVRSQEPSAQVPLRQVAWVPDGEMEARTVPASVSAADDLMHERRRQTLFSYAR